MSQSKTVYVGAEVENVLTGERFEYKGKEVRDGETLLLLESEGQTHRVDVATWKESFRAVV